VKNFKLDMLFLVWPSERAFVPLPFPAARPEKPNPNPKREFSIIVHAFPGQHAFVLARKGMNDIYPT
jgi:hypothetical protein